MAALLTGLALLAVHPVSRFYPACPIYEYFHILCPGCGATRALAALLRADFTTAWRMNPLFVCASPLLLVLAVNTYRKSIASRSEDGPPFHGAFVWGSLAIALCFGLMRNL